VGELPAADRLHHGLSRRTLADAGHGKAVEWFLVPALDYASQPPQNVLGGERSSHATG
jgi:hypothetical protein